MSLRLNKYLFDYLSVKQFKTKAANDFIAVSQVLDV